MNFNSTEWKNNRKNLKTLSQHSSHTSSLKKKQAILNKLKNIATENFTVLIADLENENLNKFHTEIVNNLLANPTLAPVFPLKSIHIAFDNVHKVVQIIYLFYFDQSFTSFLISSLKKSYTASWQIACILLETSILNTQYKKQAKQHTQNSITKAIFDSMKCDRIPFVLYALLFTTVDNSIFLSFIKEEIKNPTEENIDILRIIASKMGIDKAITLPNTYIEIIKPFPGEFSFYDEEPEKKDTLIPEFTIGILRSIEKRDFDSSKLIDIGQSIRNMSDANEVLHRLIKKKKHIVFIPYLAKILTRALKNKKSYSEAILNSIYKAEDLLLIAECYKCGLFTQDEIFRVMDTLIHNENVTALCILLSNLGRYLLYKKETNLKTIDMIERIKTISLTGVQKIQLANCLTTIIHPQGCKISIIDFLRWFLNNPESFDTDLMNEMCRSPRFRMILLSQPGIFTNKELLKRFVSVGKCRIQIQKFYIDLIPQIYEKHKALAFEYVQALISVTESVTEQRVVVEKILGLKINEKWKYQAALTLLEEFDACVRDDYVERLKRAIGNTAIFFNFCEKYGYSAENNEDSFDREFEMMEETSEST